MRAHSPGTRSVYAACPTLHGLARNSYRAYRELIGVRSTLEHAVALQEGKAARDRKSTRLNSSHQIISYAVFCLKKKKMKAALEATKYPAQVSDEVVFPAA